MPVEYLGDIQIYIIQMREILNGLTLNGAAIEKDIQIPKYV